MLCILYTIAVGTAIGLAAWLFEAAAPSHWSRRWIWLGAVSLSIALPPIYRARHHVFVSDAHAAASSWWLRIGTFDSTLMQIWSIVTWLLMAAVALSVIRTWLLIRRSRIGHEVVDGVPVTVTETVGPATVGTRVLIPRWVLALPPAHRAYVVRHEHEHRASHDAQLLFCASLLVIAAPWYLPLYWQLRRFALAVEIDCDRRVVAGLGDAREYGQLLVNVAAALTRAPELQPSFLGRSGSLERRLTVLMDGGDPTIRRRIALGILGAALLLLVLLVPHPLIAGLH